MKTPGVYIVEKSAFPNSVVEVATAVPAFIGYTEKAVNGTTSLTNKPWKISSMSEFQKYFGGAPTPTFTILSPVEIKVPDEGSEENGQKKAEDKPVATPVKVVENIIQVGRFSIKVESNYTLYYNMMLFFANGGGSCYIVSVGDYKAEQKADSLIGGLSSLTKEIEPTMVVIPEAVNLPLEECSKIQQQMLMHCGGVMRNRIAILDVRINKFPQTEETKDYITPFRESVGNNLSYGAAYYPWLATSTLSNSDISEDFIKFGSSITEFVTLALPDDSKKEDLLKYFKEGISQNILSKEVHQILKQNVPAYQQIVKSIKDSLNLLPPSAAMAGIYSMVDNQRGVWKAPANVSVNMVISPSVNITNAEQEDLNVPLNGKAINAIRSFVGDGIKVWGARTLDGNSLDWRYINVRRTIIFLEESVKNAARAFVFDPNDSNTWINMKCMIENFLQGVWKRGGLAGASPEDAYSVHVGLGETMTPEDVLEGIMRITVLVAVSRPAEFIEITFQQQMQKS